jgi:hypothetical protein
MYEPQQHPILLYGKRPGRKADEILQSSSNFCLPNTTRIQQMLSNQKGGIFEWLIMM